MGAVTGHDALLDLHVDAWVASPWWTMHKRASGSKVPVFSIVGIPPRFWMAPSATEHLEDFKQVTSLASQHHH